MSPTYEILRYGHDKIKNQVEDAHRMGKLAKFIFRYDDLVDQKEIPAPWNYRFEACQAETPDVVLFINKDRSTLIIRGAHLLEQYPEG